MNAQVEKEARFDSVYKSIEIQYQRGCRGRRVEAAGDERELSPFME
jgi:hypothetical protein